MRIAFICNSSQFFLSHKLPLAMEWLRRGADVHLLTPAPGIQLSGIEHHEIRMSRSGISPFEISSVFDIRRVLRRVRPDLLHNFSLKPSLYGTIAAGDIPVVNAITGLGHTFISTDRKMRLARRAIETGFRVFGSAATYIFQTAHDRDVFSAFVHLSRCHVVPGSGVDTSKFSVEAPTGRVVLYAGRMLSTKGVREFIAAASLVNAEFWLAGAPDPGNPASLTADELRASGCRWLGHVDDVAALMKRSAIVCLPSYSEGVPKTLIEAASSGRPIIATDIPGCREVCISGVNGILVPPRDAVAIANAASTILDDQTLWRKFSAASRRLALSVFDERHIVQQTFYIYEREIWKTPICA